jgi:hypothetical protein
MRGFDQVDAATEKRLADDAVTRYTADSTKAGKPVKAIHKASVDGIEVVLEDAKGNALARYPWIYDPLVGMARLK